MLFPKKNEKLVRFGQQKNDYYIARSDVSSKLTKAESLGVKVLSEAEFKEMTA